MIVNSHKLAQTKIVGLLLAASFCVSFKGDSRQVIPAYKEMLQYFFTNNPYAYTGYLLPYREKKRDDDLPLAIHVELKMKNRPEILKILRKEYSRSIVYADCGHEETAFIQASPATDTSELVYSSKNRHVMGTLTILGVYKLIEKGVVTRIYFDIIRRSALRDKSQFNDIFEFRCRNGKWTFYTFANIEKS